MANRYQRGNDANEPSPNMSLAPALAASMWNPFLGCGSLKGNAHAQEGFGTIASEWQDFVGHRVQEDIALMQRLTHSCTPDQILAELSTMTKLMSGVTSRMVTAAQTATEEVSKQSFPWQRTAA
jgi:hypothetical protein